MFVNRKKELGVFNDLLQSRKGELLILYGRRRVGKTELIKEAFKKKKHLYYMAYKHTELEQLINFSRLLGEFFNDPILKEQPLKSWDLIFTYLSQKIESFNKKKMVIVLDEFPYLVESQQALPSIIQKFWDETGKQSNILLVLCGSSVGFMEREVLGHKSPLFGRRTRQLHLTPFSYREMKKFFPGKDAFWLFDVYSVFGGVPAYLDQVNPNLKIFKNIEKSILAYDRFLFDEVRFLLMQELREPRHYLLILRGIASGRTTINELVQFSELKRDFVGKYLDILQTLRLVHKNIPVTVKNPDRYRKGYYSISDEYFKFWFCFIYPYLSEISDGRGSDIISNIKAGITRYQGEMFEKISIDYLKDKMDCKEFPLSLHKIGRWWDKGDEIDIVGINNQTGEVLLGECKYTEKMVGNSIYIDLQDKGERHFKDYKKSYCFFSKSGYTASFMKIAKNENIYLYQLTKKGFGKP